MSSVEKSFPFRIEFPPELPISVRAEEITAAIAANQVVILAGETGSGKTTQIPKMCLAAGRGSRGRIGCTQPRRVAALSISRRVAEELGVAWGREVGCKVRFADQTSRATVVKFVTDGMLLAELQGDPLLREYDTIIIDEAHERSLNIDFLLGHLRTLRYRRPDLKVVITSATIDTEAFSAAFDGAPVVIVEGRTYPVETIFAPLDERGRDYTDDDENAEADAAAATSAKAEALHYIDGTVEAIDRIVHESPSGDILAFLPSERDIRETRDLLEGRFGSQGPSSAIEVVPLFGRLSNAEQQRVFAPTQRRKIVLATNIAETSLTIPGIRFVVDTGLARISRYSVQSRTRRLPIEPIAQSSAEQRKGRAGRVADGVCIRLFSEKDFLERPRFTQPEIQRANLADVILRMKAFGLGDIERFPFLNQPAAKAVRAGYALLEELGAIEQVSAVDARRDEVDRAADPTPTSPSRAPANRPGRAIEPDHPALTPEKRRSGVNSLAESEGSLYLRELTSVGRELARLPVDPTVGRMILQARTERALREVLIIAAGLSIQDPRERPLDRQPQADAAHRRFAHPDSDFLTLLKIWDAYHDEFETLSQAKLRRFCRDHFLSYPRMREWRDIYGQLLEVLEERKDFRLTSAFDAVGRGKAEPRHSAAPPDRRSPDSKRESHRGEDPLAFGTPSYRAIHRSILAGLLGDVACLDEETGGYKATHDRRVVLFPGSVLFRREEARKRSPGPKASPRNDGTTKKLPRWIMAAEIVETSRLYARTCARLDPGWILELATHVLRVAHSEPFWHEAAGRVMVKQRTRLYGLELDSRAIGYGRIDPVHATEIFIREGLVNDTIQFPLDFIPHNRAVRERIEDLLTRARDSGYLNLDEAAYRFYAARLLPSPGSRNPDVISSVAELVDLVRHRRTTEPRFLFITAEDLRDPATIQHDATAFPSSVPLENRALPLNYAYKPGQPDDGVTLTVSVREAEALTPAALDWAVPGHLEPKVEHYLRTLPKELRRAFVPLGETAKQLAAELRSETGGRALREALAALIAKRFRIAIDSAVWADKPLPEHWRVRVRVVDNDGCELCASRDLGEVSSALFAQSRAASKAVARAEPEAWRAARAQWETPESETWAFDRIPARILVAEQGGTPAYAFPGLSVGAKGVARRLFKLPEEADVATRDAIGWLLEHALGHDLMWTQRDLRALRDLGPLATTLAPIDVLQDQAFASIRRWAIDPARVMSANTGEDRQSNQEPPLTSDAFRAAADRARAELRGLVPRLVDLLREILALRQELLVVKDPPPDLERQLAELIPADFLVRTPFPRLQDLPRYLKAMERRAERWRKNPRKDAERVAHLGPYEKALRELQGVAKAGGRKGSEPRPDAAALVALRWLFEEYRVSLFAQELGTSEPVSAVKLDRAIAEVRRAVMPRAESSAVTPPAAKPIVARSIPEKAKKSVPLKNLGALDKLFGR